MELGLQDYLRFVENRFDIWRQRQESSDGSWETPDPILDHHKFTNVFRICDPGTQFVMTDLVTDNPLETLVRLFLYRHTGRVAAWEWFGVMNGFPPVISDLEDGTFREAFAQFRESGQTIFTGAYIVRPQSQTAPTDYTKRNADKLDAVIARTLDLVHSGVAERVLEAEGYPDQQFKLLTTIPNVGDFMAMQTLTDFWYTPHNGGRDSENEFVVAGPGAVRGARHLFPEVKPLDTIRYLQGLFFGKRVYLDLPGGVRYPSLMDVQNTLCEWGKYVRFSERTPKTAPAPYRATHPGRQPRPVFPTHWVNL